MYEVPIIKVNGNINFQKTNRGKSRLQLPVNRVVDITNCIKKKRKCQKIYKMNKIKIKKGIRLITEQSN